MWSPISSVNLEADHIWNLLVGVVAAVVEWDLLKGVIVASVVIPLVGWVVREFSIRWGAE